MERWRGRGRGSGRESGGGQGGRETNIYRPLFFERERERAEEVTEERQRGVGRQGGQFWSACHYTHTHTHTHTHQLHAHVCKDHPHYALYTKSLKRRKIITQCPAYHMAKETYYTHKRDLLIPQAPQDHHAMSGKGFQLSHQRP
jgi:hypothetical protein